MLIFMAVFFMEEEQGSPESIGEQRMRLF